MEGSITNSEDRDLSDVMPVDFDGNAIEFSIGNPRVEHITGVVHLYRPEPSKDHLAMSPSSSKGQPPPVSIPSPPENAGREICVMAIPPDMSVANFCQFCGAYLRHIQQIRVVRRESSQRTVCMVLITLEDDKTARMFFQDYNNKPFSSLEPDVLCRLLFVKDVQIVEADGKGTEPAAPQGQTELPTCPVCLERLDEHISGIVTTVCNHKFHSSCLSKWADAGCPVCRYCVQPGTGSSRCTACGTSADLWICLICGHVGCGRYRDGHASDHWKSSQHCYAMELETQRVWDYVGDGYVHRLVQSKTDGMLVEVPSPHPICSTSCSRLTGDCDVCGPSTVDEEVKQAVVDSKLDAITLEYNHLLTSQLDSQRQYFEGLLNQALAESDAQLSEANTTAHQAQEEADQARLRAKEAERSKQGLERKLGDANSRITKLEKEREYLKTLSDALVNDQKEFRSQLEQHKKELEKKDTVIQDLQEQVRDLMVFIEAQRTLGDGGEEIKGATLLPLPANSTRGSGRRRGRN